MGAQKAPGIFYKRSWEGRGPGDFDRGVSMRRSRAWICAVGPGATVPPVGRVIGQFIALAPQHPEVGVGRSRDGGDASLGLLQHLDADEGPPLAD